VRDRRILPGGKAAGVAGTALVREAIMHDPTHSRLRRSEACGRPEAAADLVGAEAVAPGRGAPGSPPHNGPRLGGEARPDAYRARYHDPVQGRFLSRDPLEREGGSPNLYDYTAGEPTAFVDPYGLTLSIANTSKVAGQETLANLQKLCPDGKLKSDEGKVALGNADICKKEQEQFKKCATKTGCECLCDVINSKFDWVIIANVGTPGGALWPHTVPTDEQGAYGPLGTGSGGTVYTTTSESKLEFGAYDPTGKAHKASDVIILGHELCGHAWPMTKGTHDPRPQPRGNRPGHDEAIAIENKIREEQQVKEMRGLFKDPKSGESVWRVAGKDKWEERRVMRRDIPADAGK
jgi:RHS repeat-associated protein